MILRVYVGCDTVGAEPHAGLFYLNPAREPAPRQGSSTSPLARFLMSPTLTPFLRAPTAPRPPASPPPPKSPAPSEA